LILGLIARMPDRLEDEDPEATIYSALNGTAVGDIDGTAENISTALGEASEAGMGFAATAASNLGASAVTNLSPAIRERNDGRCGGCGDLCSLKS
jgi:hypothetical protein